MFFIFDEQKQNFNLLLVFDIYLLAEGKSNLKISTDTDLISWLKMVIKQSQRNAYINYKNNNNFNDDIIIFVADVILYKIIH